MSSIDLDKFLGSEHPDASFHDALVEGYYFDARARSLALYVQVNLYEAPGEPRYQPGVLTFSEVLSFELEAPSSSYSRPPSSGLRLTSDGSVESLPGERKMAPPMPEALAERAFHHYLYFSDVNSFMFVAALRAEFAWREAGLRGSGGAV